MEGKQLISLPCDIFFNKTKERTSQLLMKTILCFIFTPPFPYSLFKQVLQSFLKHDKGDRAEQHFGDQGLPFRSRNCQQGGLTV